MNFFTFYIILYFYTTLVIKVFFKNCFKFFVYNNTYCCGLFMLFNLFNPNSNNTANTLDLTYSQFLENVNTITVTKTTNTIHIHMMLRTTIKINTVTFDTHTFASNSSSTREDIC